ncbi:unnamed protein product [Penicillium nalgiovense]|nr:unnamed protein product [Penicillium nalgiovense]
MPLSGPIPSLLLFSLHLYSASYRGTCKMLHSIFRILMCHFRPTLDPSGLSGFSLLTTIKFFCALNPELRPKWALRHTELLASLPAGNLICLESPRHKDPLAPGPPFASPSEAYMEHLSHPGEKISYNDKGLVDTDPLREPSKAGLERVAYWQPERTHTVGKDKNGVIHDRVSIWRRRD